MNGYIGLGETMLEDIFKFLKEKWFNDLPG